MSKNLPFLFVFIIVNCQLSIVNYQTASAQIDWVKVNADFNYVLSPTALTSSANGQILVGTEYIGIFQYDTLQKTWTHASKNSMGKDWVMEFVAGTDGRIYAVTQRADKRWYIHRLATDGITWDYYFTGASDFDIKNLRFDTSGSAFMIYNNYLMWAQKGSGNWVKAFTDQVIYGSLYCSAVLKNQNIMLVTQKGIMVWDRISYKLEKRNIDTVPIFKAVAVLKDGTVFAAGYNGKLYKTVDDGANWVKMTKPFEDTVDRFGKIYVDSKDRIYILTRFYQLYRTDDKAVTWNQLKINDTTDFAEVFGVGSNDEVYAGHNQYGLFSSSDCGANWGHLKFNAMAINVVKSCTRNGTDLIVSSENGELYSSVNGGKNWGILNRPTNLQISGLYVNKSGYIYTLNSDNSISMTLDSGRNWHPSNTGLYNNVQSMFIVNDSVLVAGTISGGIYKSSDYGLSWEKSKMDTSMATFYSFALDENKILYASSPEKGLLKSTDYGYIWQKVGTGLDNKIINLMMFDKSSKFYAVADSGEIFQSNDKGLSWYVLDILLMNTKINNLIIGTQNKLYAATGGLGVQMSTDKGSTWFSTSLAIPSDTINTMVCDSAGFLYAFTSDFELYKSAASVYSVNEELQKADEIEISPNPSDGELKIRLNIRTDTFIKITLFDMLGINKVDIGEGYYHTGNNYFETNKEQKLSTGVYFIVLNINGEILTKKVLIIHE